MRLTMKERKAVTAVLRTRYRRASKKQKGRLLDELIGLTGYNRRYAAALLGERGGSSAGLHEQVQRRARQRPRLYDAAVLSALRRIGAIMDGICGKRLAAVLPQTIAVLKRHGELAPPAATRQKLGAIRAATLNAFGGDSAAGISQRAKVQPSQRFPSATQTPAQAIARTVKAGPVRGRTMSGRGA